MKKKREEEVVQKPKPGRRAYVCRDKDGVVHTRVFLPRYAPEGTPVFCVEHGTMKRQENHPYLGMAVPEA